MLFKRRFWPGLADGTVTVAFRRWNRPTVKPSGTLQAPGGVLGIDEVVIIEPHDVTDDDARAAGYVNRAEALADLRAEGTLYRIRFHRVGDDPRAALRRRVDLGPEDLAQLLGALGRIPWAVPMLRLIAEHPATVSTDLAQSLGLERGRFKARVRRLKTLGLTESLKIGYRLSPRGQALLDRIDGAP
ncbi:MAG: hypothetical protein ACYDH6_18555 [Acidimicrobiales bacterium]